MNDRTRVKICGVRTESDVETAVHAGADAVGFVFARQSPRFIEPAHAADLTCLLPPFVEAVGLFVDTPPAEISRIAEEACLNVVQLHGDEREADVLEIASEFTVINAIRFTPGNIQQWGRNRDVDLLLIDGSTGGEGQQFNWRELADRRHDIERPVMLAGGLTSQNVGEAIRLVRPYAVDVSSGIESTRGVKDATKIHAFCGAVRCADLEASGSAR